MEARKLRKLNMGSESGDQHLDEDDLDLINENLAKPRKQLKRLGDINDLDSQEEEISTTRMKNREYDMSKDVYDSQERIDEDPKKNA